MVGCGSAKLIPVPPINTIKTYGRFRDLWIWVDRFMLTGNGMCMI